MKKLLHKSLRALFLSLAVLLSLPMLAVEVEIDGIKYELISKVKQATVKSTGKYSGEIVIPESVEHESVTYSVTSIGSSAFENCFRLTSVTIPNSVTSIGNYAFRSCSGLTSVTIPNSVTSIGDYAFEKCFGLTSVSIPNSVTSIGKWAFHYCSALTSVSIPNSVTSIGECAFYNCSGLTSVSIPNSVTSIGDWAFCNCSGLTSVTIPNSVTSIGIYAFSGCSGLTSVTIPNSVESIGSYAFSGCSGLTSVTIPNSVTSIGSEAFGDCSELLDVYCYAEKVPETKSDAFDGSYPEHITLHVPEVSVEIYKATAPWSSFGNINAIASDNQNPDEEDITVSGVLADGTLEEYVNESERSPIDIHYTRTLPNMLWNPLYVPFKIPYEVLEENYEVAYINAMHSYDNDDNGEIDDMVMEIVKIKAGTLKPNHPYLIKARNAEAMEMSIVQENTTLYPAEITTLDCSSVYTKFKITGTYQKMTSGELNGSLVISTDGAWKKLSSTSTLNPFRFYLTISSRGGSPVEIAEEAMLRVRIKVMGEDDNVTGVDELKVENVNLKTVTYDLSGRRVSTPTKGGVYIINGKSVIY